MEFESSWSKAWTDTETCRHTTFFVLNERIIVLITGFCGTYIGILQTLTFTKPTFSQQYLYAPAGSVLGAIVGLLMLNIGIYLWNVFKAPYRQRNQLSDKIKQLEREISAIQIGKPTSVKEVFIQGFEKTYQGIEQISNQIEKLSKPQSNEIAIEEKARGITQTAEGQFSYTVPIENASSINLGYIHKASQQTITGLVVSANCPEIFPITDLGYVMTKINLLNKKTFEVILMTYIEKPSNLPFSFTFSLGSKVCVTQKIPARIRGLFKEKSESFILNEKDLENISPTIVIE